MHREHVNMNTYIYMNKYIYIYIYICIYIYIYIHVCIYICACIVAGRVSGKPSNQVECRAQFQGLVAL